MPNTSSIEAGRAFLKLFVEDAEFRRGLDNSLRKLDTFGRSLTEIGTKVGLAGAAITAPFVASLKVFSDTGSAIFDMSQKTGLSAASLSELKYAAEQSGASLETIGKAARALQKEGIDPKRFDELANSIAAISDPTERAQRAFEVFGARVGSELLPMFEDLQKLRQEARDTGAVMSDEAAASADALGDSLGKMKAASQAVAISIGSAVAPAVSKVSDLLASNTATIAKWLRENDEAVVVVGGLGVGLIGLSAAMTPVIAATSGLAVAVVALSTPVGAATAAVAAMGAAMAGVLATTGHLQAAVKSLSRELGDAVAAFTAFAKIKAIFGAGQGGVINFDELRRLRGQDTSAGSATASQTTAIAPREPDDPLGFADEQRRKIVQDLFTFGKQALGLSKPGGGGTVPGFFGPLINPLAVLPLLDNINQLSAVLAGPTGTFSGRLASQVFGQRGDASVGQRHRELVRQIQETNSHLRRIERRGGIRVGAR